MEPAAYFVENLTLRLWATALWPRLLWAKVRRKRMVSHCYVIDGSGFALMMSRVLGSLTAVSVERLHFRFAGMRDEAGRSLRLRLLYHDLAEVQKKAMAEPEFRKIIDSKEISGRQRIFLSKRMTMTDINDRSTIWRDLHLVHICRWKINQDAIGKTPVLFLERRPWLKTTMGYAAEHSVELVPVNPTRNVSATLRRIIPSQLMNSLRRLRYGRSLSGLSWPISRNSSLSPKSTGEAKLNGQKPEPNLADGNLRIDDQPNSRVSVEYHGMLNLLQPERHSDVFFWQQSALPGSSLLLTLSVPLFPIGTQEWDELRQHGMDAIALHPGATSVPAVPVFKQNKANSKGHWAKSPIKHLGPEGAWAHNQLVGYWATRSYWTDLATRHKIKVFLSWYKYDASHCAVADALQAIGGITAIYQRAYEGNSSAETTIAADVVFGFATDMAEVERLNGSEIRYHVTTGYIGDHRFELVKNSAQALRSKLQGCGANRILAYLDENTLSDPRWVPGHQVAQADYAFLLEKVLAEPWLGLVIKPKIPSTLRERLGPVAKLLERAEATGRCYVFEAHNTGLFYGYHPPAEAGLASDLVIHGNLGAATAGMETALAGVPTLLLDPDGWPESPLYQLGTGTVVFTEWDDLWLALRNHWDSQDGTPGFGDWSEMLDELDPFRDGHAAQRMGTYLHWLIDGFNAGLERDRVMEDAASRYTAIWGVDKITQVNGVLPVASSQQRAEQGTAR